MPQHDLTIANQNFPNTRTDLNNALLALGQLQSGPTAPATTYAYMPWFDTTTGRLKIRNAANSDWLFLGEANDSAGAFQFYPGNMTPTLAGQSEAEARTENSKLLTPLRGDQLAESRIGMASVSVASSGGLNTAWENRASVAFTATTTNGLFIANFSVNSLVVSVNDFLGDLRIYDTVTTTTVASFATGESSNAGLGYAVNVTIAFMFAALVKGRTYEAQLWLRKVQANGPHDPRNLGIQVLTL